jgi:transcriptional regulator with XRE-family HTH domain
VGPDHLGLLHASVPVYGHPVRDDPGHEPPALSLYAAGASSVRRARRSPTVTLAVAAHRHRVSVAHAVARARRRLRLDHGAFAEALRVRLQQAGESVEGVTEVAVSAWEKGLAMPSALALLAAADVAGVDPELLFNRPPVVERLEQLEGRVRSQAVQLEGLRFELLRQA